MIILLGLPGGMEFMFVFMLLGVALIPLIFYLLLLQNTLRLISPENREMPAENVWLLLIPVFNLVWQFIVLDRLTHSISAELRKRDLSSAQLPSTYNVGLAMCILNCCVFIPVINSFCGIGAVVCWIIYWVRIAGFKNLLSAGN